VHIYAETFRVRLTEKQVENLNLVLNYYGLTKGTRSERFRLLVDQLALRVRQLHLTSPSSPNSSSKSS
jgi:hypothetical protein